MEVRSLSLTPAMVAMCWALRLLFPYLVLETSAGSTSLTQTSVQESCVPSLEPTWLRTIESTIFHLQAALLNPPVAVKKAASCQQHVMPMQSESVTVSAMRAMREWDAQVPEGVRMDSPVQKPPSCHLRLRLQMLTTQQLSTVLRQQVFQQQAYQQQMEWRVHKLHVQCKLQWVEKVMQMMIFV